MESPLRIQRPSRHPRLTSRLELRSQHQRLPLQALPPFVSPANQSGASVYVDGVLVGAAPATIPGIALGKHTFEIRKEGYQTWSQTIIVTQGFTTRIVSFNPTLIVMSAIPTLTAVPTGTASIRLASSPPGASVSVDGREVGKTPVVVSGFTEGKHTIQMKLGGYKTWTHVITVTPDFMKRTMSYNPSLVKA